VAGTDLRPAGSILRRLGAGLATVLLAGCTTLPPAPAPLSLEGIPGDGEPVWQRTRFWIHWPQDEDPAWHVDALLAHRVIGPVLERNRASIALWRFHRRAARDGAGHSLSFLVYAPPARGEALCRGLREDPRVGALIRAGVLDKVACSSPPGKRAALVEGTSDPGWPSEIQRTWPWYIQGVSEMWLRLIDQLADPGGDRADPATVEDLVAHYRALHGELTGLWAEEGEHAFLHHLNALFAYEPLYLIERRPYRF
jgi:hypothetical protein